MKLDQVAVQLYTLRSLTEQDMLGTLSRLAEIGYRAVELAGYGNSTPQKIQATLQANGMRAVAAHIRLERIEEQFEDVVAELKTLGCRYVVVPIIGEGYRGSVEQARALAERLNSTGQRLSEQGIRLAYHNHQFEFAPLDGTTMWETLVANTDPALVDFELDVYWAVDAGFDPVALLQRHAERLKLVHLKDRARDTFAPVGTGSIVWEPILAAATHTEWYIVEQDTADDPLGDVRLSFQTVQRLAET